MASGKKGAAPIQIHADANVYSAYISPGKTLKLPVASDRQVYLALIEGAATVGKQHMYARDAMEFVGEDIEIQAADGQHAHVYVIEMAKQ